MGDPRQDPRIRHGLIPILVAMRVKAEREQRAKDEAARAATDAKPKPRKRGWFG